MGPKFVKDVIECVFELEMGDDVLKIRYLSLRLFLCLLQFCWICQLLLIIMKVGNISYNGVALIAFTLYCNNLSEYFCCG
jgi:hypothetical protein